MPARFDLFTTFADRASARAKDVIANIGCPWPPSELQRRVLGYMLYSQGKAKAMPLGLLGERLKQSPRQIKELVQELRLNFGVQICASRDGDAGGYYLAETAAEVEESIQLMWNQAITMLRVCRRMRGPEHELREMLGQIELELGREAGDAQAQ